jgi:hypothetical protein
MQEYTDRNPNVYLPSPTKKNYFNISLNISSGVQQRKYVFSRILSELDFSRTMNSFIAVSVKKTSYYMVNNNMSPQSPKRVNINYLQSTHKNIASPPQTVYIL